MNQENQESRYANGRVNLEVYIRDWNKNLTMEEFGRAQTNCSQGKYESKPIKIET